MHVPGGVLLAGDGIHQKQVFNTVILFLGKGQGKLRDTPEEVFTAQNRENMPALLAGTSIRFIQRGDAVVLVGLFELFGKIVVN